MNPDTKENQEGKRKKKKQKPEKKSPALVETVQKVAGAATTGCF